MKIKVLEYKPRSDSQKHPGATIELENGQKLDVRLEWWMEDAPTLKRATKFVLDRMRDAVREHLADETVKEVYRELDSGTAFELDLDE